MFSGVCLHASEASRGGSDCDSQEVLSDLFGGGKAGNKGARWPVSECSRQQHSNYSSERVGRDAAATGEEGV